MRITSGVLWMMAVFFIPTATLYSLFTGWSEMVGTVTLFLLAGMSAMSAFYLRHAASKLDPAPGDDPRAQISQGAGDYGFFSPGSGWPVMLAFSGTLLFLGLAVGWWVFIIGVVLGAVSLLGWTFEYFRGDIF